MNTNNRQRYNAVDAAIDEAERFLAAAYSAKEELESDYWVTSSKKFAATKRASMDLSNALVKVRQSSM